MNFETDDLKSVCLYIKCCYLGSAVFYRILDYSDLEWLCEKWVLVSYGLDMKSEISQVMPFFPNSSPSGYNNICLDSKILTFSQELAVQYSQSIETGDLAVDNSIAILHQWRDYLDRVINERVELIDGV